MTGLTRETARSRRTLQLAEECINTAGENLEGAIRNTRYGSENAQDARHKIDSVLGHVEGSNPDAALDDTREGKRKSQSSEEERSGAQDRLEKLRVNLRSARENLNLYLERLSFWHSGDREYLAKDALRALDNALSCNDTAQGAADDLRRSIGRAGEAIDDVQGELQKSR